MLLQNKEQIRQNIRSIISNISTSQQDSTIKLLHKRFNNLVLPFIDNSKIIALYYPFKLELNILPIIANLPHKLALPVINNWETPLTFRLWDQTTKLEPSLYYPRILEPSKLNEEIIPDVVIAPLTACDINKNRIGSGKGLYDITIKDLRTKHPNILVLSICYDFQLFDSIICEKHDQKLDIILTEKRFIY
jgi:5-formyltetrahydrofolate cyclo-ligase